MVVALALLVVAVAGGVLLAGTFDNTLFWVEASLIVLFAVFWIIQTAERWPQTCPPSSWASSQSTAAQTKGFRILGRTSGSPGSCPSAAGHTLGDLAYPFCDGDTAPPLLYSSVTICTATRSAKTVRCQPADRTFSEGVLGALASLQ